MNKVYVIRYRAHEFDDLGWGSFDPVFISLDKSKVQERFEKIKETDINNLNRILNQIFDGKEQEDYRVEENTEENFELWLGNWYYEYYIEEYPLDVNIIP